MAGPLRFESWTTAEGLCAYRWVADRPSPDEALSGYVAFVWGLAKGRACYAVPRYWRENVTAVIGSPVAHVRWEYEVASFEAAEAGSIREFVPALSNDEPEALAGFYEVQDPATLRRIVDALLQDASCEMNVYAVEAGSGGRVVAALGSDDPPGLADVLGPNDVFVDVVIGVDLDFRDVLVVQSKRELESEIVGLTHD